MNKRGEEVQPLLCLEMTGQRLVGQLAELLEMALAQFSTANF
jgi:hypothetical protein